MPRPAHPELQMVKEALSADTLGPDEKLTLIRRIRSEGELGSDDLDRLLVESLHRSRLALREVQGKQGELRRLLEELKTPPWFPATVIRVVPTRDGVRAMVQQGSQRRLVGIGDGVASETLVAGAEVYLGAEQNLIMALAPDGAPECGETAQFERRLSDGRLVVRWHEQAIVIRSAHTLASAGIEPGDEIRFSRESLLAYEALPRHEQRRFLLEDVGEVGRDRVGGQEKNLERLLAVLTGMLVDPAKASRYGRTGRRSVLFVGPPGCGKTLMARVAASELKRQSGAKCRFGIVKPAEWEDPYVGQTEANIRKCFSELRAAAEDGLAMLFLDEVEAIGRIRGGISGRHADRFLAALLAEIDGFASRTGVAILAATNRKDLVDPALLERLSGVEIQVGRPDLRGARAILDVHLRPDLAYHTNGIPSDATRTEIIETAVSRLYSPNGLGSLCTLKFRDNRSRPVAIRELVSGRLLQQVCDATCDRAFLRDLRGGEPGLRKDDMEEALVDVVDRLRTTLSPRNAHAYIEDLPSDVDVIAVEAPPRRVSKPHRYFTLEEIPTACEADE